MEFDVGTVLTGGLGRLVLPIRSRGTRVWIFCSRFLTFARISDTIWTPRLLEVVVEAPMDVTGAVEEPAACEVERSTMVLGGMREGVDNEGNVVDLLRDIGVCGEVILRRDKENPARWSKIDCPDSESADDVNGLGASGTESGISDSGGKSGSSRSGGG